MSRRKILLYPLVLALAIFLLDKVALIPAVQAAGRPGPTPMENMVRSMDHFFDLYREAVSAKREGRPLHIVFGSSRSEMFQNLTEKSIDATPFLDREEKQDLKRVYFEPRMAYKAADLFMEMVFVSHIVETGRRPGLIVLELSPEMFNRNSPSNINKYLYENIYPISDLAEFYPLLDGDLKREIRNRLLFASYAFRFRPERLLQRSPGDSSSLAELLLVARQRQEEPPADFKDYNEGSIPPSVYKSNFLGYARYLRTNFVLRNYQFDSGEENSFYHILDISRKAGIPIVVWLPHVHPALDAIWSGTEFERAFPRIRNRIEKAGVPFLDARHLDIKCKWYVDSSHLSRRCAPYMMERIEEKAREVYGDSIYSTP